MVDRSVGPMLNLIVNKESLKRHLVIKINCITGLEMFITSPKQFLWATSKKPMEKVKKNYRAPVSTWPTLKAPQSESAVKKKTGARTKHSSVSSNDKYDENQHLIRKSCNLSLGPEVTFFETVKSTNVSNNNKVIKVTNIGSIEPEDQDLLEINPLTPANNLNNSNVSGAATTDAGTKIPQQKLWNQN